jgi:diphthamide biosynthesis methyltransferase
VWAARLSSKNEMLYVIGLGLSDEKDITVRGLEAVKSCERVYLEAYTSILMVDSSKLVSLVSEYFSAQQV